MRKQLMATIPLCWKCSNAIMDDDAPGIATLVCCGEDESIKTYADANERCPLIQDNGGV